jgi:hypothetical protein
VRHSLDRSVAGVRINRSARQHDRLHLVREPRRRHRGHPAALAKADQIDAPAEIVDRDDQLGQVVVDLQTPHVGGRRFPVGQQHMAKPVCKQCFDQTLARLVVGDRRRVPCVGRIDKGGNPAGRAVFAQEHGAQLEPQMVRRGERRPQPAKLDLLRHKFEISGVKIESLLDHRCGRHHRPECRHADR